MPDKIILHEANGDRRGFITADLCAALERAGKGFAVRSRRGGVVRFVLYPHSRETVYYDVREGVLALHHCSRSTRPMRGDGSFRYGKGQLLGEPRSHREHIPTS